MRTCSWNQALLALLATAWMAAPAHAVPIRDLPIVGLGVYEVSGGETRYNMVPDGTVPTTKLADRLSFSNNDYLSNSNEYYDFFYSDADGTFNPDGAYLTITAIFDNAADAGLNVSRADLVFADGTIEFASVVSSFVAIGAFASPGTATNALGDTPGTITFLGDTVGQPDSVRLSLTLGFASSVVPEPAWLGLLGISGLALAGHRRLPRRD